MLPLAYLLISFVLIHVVVTVCSGYIRYRQIQQTTTLHQNKGLIFQICLIKRAMKPMTFAFSTLFTMLFSCYFYLLVWY